MSLPILESLVAIFGQERVNDDPAFCRPLAEDMSEAVVGRVDCCVFPLAVGEIQELCRLCDRERVPITARVAGTNLGGLTIPGRGGVVCDFTRMNRVLTVNPDDMLAIIEPGVTFGGLKQHLSEANIPLTIGYPLSPPETSVMANCLLDGLGNLSLRHGSMGEWVSGLEVVRADGSLLRTGSMASGGIPYGRPPLPDLTGLFISTQGTAGLCVRMAVQLWPSRAHRLRMFLLTYDRATTFRAMRELPRLGIFDDMGGLSWPTSKMLFGVERPRERDPGEPEFFTYLDLSGCDQRELRLKHKLLIEYVRRLRREGLHLEEPIDIPTLVRINARFSKFAEFPTRLDFLLDNSGGGLTWVGTYGPMSRFDVAADKGLAILERHGFPPTMVSRPMKGAHFGVLRFITIFDRRDAAEVERVRSCNREICEAVFAEGFVIYKTPPWAVSLLRDRLDPGFLRLLGEVKALLDPHRILNPGKW